MPKAASGSTRSSNSALQAGICGSARIEEKSAQYLGAQPVPEPDFILESTALYDEALLAGLALPANVRELAASDGRSTNRSTAPGLRTPCGAT